MQMLLKILAFVTKYSRFKANAKKSKTSHLNKKIKHVANITSGKIATVIRLEVITCFVPFFN